MVLTEKNKEYTSADVEIVLFTKEDVVNTALSNAGVGGEIGDNGGESFGG